MLAPSAFLASAASTLELQQSILPEGIMTSEDNSTESAEILWTTLSGASKPTSEQCHIQTVWDGLVWANQMTAILSRTSDVTDKARLLAVSSPHAGDWLHAPPIASVGLRLSDEAVRVAVAHRLGSKPCEPHTCVCGKPVSAQGLHGLACRRSGPRHQRHSQLNDILWRAFSRAQVPAVKEPVGLTRDDGKRPNGVKLLPWARGKPLAWDVTVPDTYANSYLTDTASRGSSWQDGKYQGGKIQQTDQQPYICSSCCWNSGDVEPPSCGTNTGAGPKNISRHSRHKRNRFPVSMAVRGSTTGKCGLLPTHFHHRISVAVVILPFFL